MKHSYLLSISIDEFVMQATFFDGNFHPRFIARQSFDIKIKFKASYE